MLAMHVGLAEECKWSRSHVGLREKKEVWPAAAHTGLHKNEREADLLGPGSTLAIGPGRELV